MTTAAIREKLHQYIDSADDSKVIEILDFIEDETDGNYDYRTDSGFWDEMDKRVEELKSGEVQGVSWEEVKRKAKEITG